MKWSSVAQIEEQWCCQIEVGIMKKDHLDWRSVSSAVEVLLFDSHNTDESDEEDVDKYFGDDCMFH